MCKGCYYCRLSLGTHVNYECALNRSDQFNNPYLHGLLCINKKTEAQVEAEELTKLEKERNAK